jgi:hypothetical protein
MLALLSSCGSSSNGGGSSPSVAPPAYCSPVSYSSGITITGSGGYQYRQNGNQEVVGPNPIRYAEVEIRNSAGELIQCGQTGSTGTFSLQVPASNESLRLSITSRSNNQFVRAYVMASPLDNLPHRISRDFVADTSKNIGSIVAPATGSLQGGAFNILDKILDANNFLRAETSGCGSIHSSCVPFEVAPLSFIYWAPGQDPGVFFSGIAGVSFYIPGTNRMYLLGGSNGDVNNSDTDHFDNTIILHEYAHYLEDVYAASDSPGGPHTGNTILDPRLAWGEGWANYFQAAVTGEYVYLDTIGTIDGNPMTIFNENLELGINDKTETLGEANFREFSITRALVDFTDTNNECNGIDTDFEPPSLDCDGQIIDNMTAPFAELWALTTSSSVGLRRSDAHFIDLGLFYTLHGALSGRSNWSDIQAAENQQSDREHYANTLNLSGGGCTVRIQAQNISSQRRENGTPQNSNQFASNDFYQYQHNGGPLNIGLSYSTTPSSPADLNLYLYRRDYRFGSLSDVIGMSENTISNGSSSGTESISLGNLAPGIYMININVYTGVRLGSAADYNLTVNGQNACPN